MKLARYRAADGEHWGAVDLERGLIRRLAGSPTDWAPSIRTGGAAALDTADATDHLEGVRLLAPLLPTSEINGIEWNHPGFQVPPDGVEPPIYTKPLASIVGPDELLRFPDLITIQPQCRFCCEVHLVAVIGSPRVRDNRHGRRDVLGYTVGNDGTLRGEKPSFVGMDLFGSKSAHQASALGPWIVTPDELGGDAPPDLEMTAALNGVVIQRGRTSEMRWGVDQVIEATNYRSTLTTGDAVFTGSCGYVGPSDGHYLAGDVVEVTIEGIGTLRNVVEDTDPYPMHPSQRWAGLRSLPGVHPVGTGGARP
jgi:2-keto-4-pentenoate hydratase/2-oxohepta-3-ene-1,7-dioic acid hydratase in catechol pathway